MCLVKVFSHAVGCFFFHGQFALPSMLLTHLISACGRQREAYLWKFQASQGYIVRAYL